MYRLHSLEGSSSEKNLPFRMNEKVLITRNDYFVNLHAYGYMNKIQK
jgi:hypothetical protein